MPSINMAQWERSCNATTFGRQQPPFPFPVFP
jgi:hypothetical protein